MKLGRCQVLCHDEQFGERRECNAIQNNIPETKYKGVVGYRLPYCSDCVFGSNYEGSLRIIPLKERDTLKDMK